MAVGHMLQAWPWGTCCRNGRGTHAAGDGRGTYAAGMAVGHMLQVMAVGHMLQVIQVSVIRSHVIMCDVLRRLLIPGMSSLANSMRLSASPSEITNKWVRVKN